MARRNKGHTRPAYDLLEYYTCPHSGWGYPIWRKRGQGREKKHLKKLYCPCCNEEHNFKKSDKDAPLISYLDKVVAQV